MSVLAAFPPEGAIRLDRFEVDAGTLNAVGQATLARGFDHFSGDAPFVQGLDASVTVTPQGGRALGLDLAPYVQGGFALDARFSDPGGGAPPGAMLLFDMTEARLEIPALYWFKPAGEPGTVSVRAAYQVADAPTLARLLTIATLTGIVDVLQGEGIAFSEFVLPFSIEDDVVTVRNARTSGFSLGVTRTGVSVDLGTRPREFQRHLSFTRLTR